MDAVDHTKKGTRIVKYIGLGCGGAIVLVILMILFAVARTGLVRVPILGAGYKPPEPTRVVEMSGTRSSLLLDDLFSSATTSFTQGGLSVELSEALMTQAMRDVLSRETTVPDFLMVEEVQIAALSNGVLELFVPIELTEGRRSAFMGQFSIGVDEEGKLVTRVEQLAIGKLVSRKGVPTDGVDTWINGMLDSLLVDAQDTFQITDIEILEGRVRVTGKLHAGY
ncbi:MAG: hypothetical protein AAB570_03555 [Patescibacteria group bacterium]